MKLDALDHPKLYDLAARLGVPRPTAIGHLELLWAFTARYASEGDVGRHPVGAIARACDWMGEPQAFVDALVAAGWLDAGEVLTIHDWHDHRPRWVASKVVRAARRTNEPTVVATVVGSVVATTDATAEATSRLVKSSQAKPSQANREPRKRGDKTGLPDDFALTAKREDYAREQGITDPAEQLERFRLHHGASGSRFKDWDLAWMKWCRNAKDFTRGKQGGTSQQGAYHRILEANGVIPGTARRIR